jgi:hypothetical protein
MAIAGVVCGAVGAIAGIVIVVLAMRSFHQYMDESKTSLARIDVNTLANEAFPQWARSHPDKACPDRIDELFEYIPGDRSDPWGRPYKMRCKDLPPGAHGIAIFSAGEDGVEGTADDIKSW